MKLLKLLARVLPHSWFIALLSSRVCRGIRIRLISRSFESKSHWICYRLETAVSNAFNLDFTDSQIQHIFKMNHNDAVRSYGAFWNKSDPHGWWFIKDPNREKYHNSLFFKQ